MSTLYLDNFESRTVGSAVPGWTGIYSAGGSSGTPGAYVAVSAAPLNGSRSFGMGTAPPNSGALYTSNSSSDHGITYTLSLYNAANNDFRHLGPIVRGHQSSGVNGDGYSAYLDLNNGANGNLTLIRCDTDGLLATSSANFSTLLGGNPATGTPLKIRLEAQGTTIRAKVWLASSAEPSGWQVTVTDSTFTSGSAGFRNVAYNPGSASIDDVSIYDFTTPTMVASPASVAVSSTGTTITLTGTNTHWDNTPPTFSASVGTITNQVINSATSATLTYNAPASGSSVSFTDPTNAITGSLGLTGSVAAGNTIAPNNPGYLFTGRWNVTPTAAITICSGAVCEFAFSGPSCVLNFDVSTVSTSGVGAAPVLAYWVDGVGPTRAAIPSSGQVTITPAYDTLPSGNPPYSSVVSSAHRIKFTANIDSCYTETGPNNWASQTQALKFQGATLASGSTLIAPPTNPNTIEFLGDSITAGLRMLYNGTNGNAFDAVELSWALQAADWLSLKPIVNGHGGQGITTTSTDGSPPISSAFGSVYSGVAWNPVNPPAVVFVYQGTNDGNGFSTSQYQTLLTTVRSAYPNALIFATVPYQCGDVRKTSIQSAVAALGDPKVFSLDYSTSFTPSDTADGTHFNPGGALKMAARVASDLQAKLNVLGVKLQAPTTSAPSVTAYSVLGLPSTAVVGTTYPISVVLNNPASSPFTATFGTVSGISWGGPVSISPGGVFGTTTVRFGQSGTYSPTILHSGGGSGISSDPVLAQVVASSPSIGVTQTGVGLGGLAPSGGTFTNLNSGGLAGQVLAVIQANPSLDQQAGLDLCEGGTRYVERSFHDLAQLVDSYLRGDPIDPSDLNARLANYVNLFTTLAQATSEIAAITLAEPGTVETVPAPSGVGPMKVRVFS